MSKAPIEALLTAVVLLATTAIATDYMSVPPHLFYSPVSSVLLVILALVAFSVYPAVGLSLFLLIAVLFFKRNVDRTMSSASQAIKPAARGYGETTIMDQPHVTTRPYETDASGPRTYNEFQETNPQNPMYNTVKTDIKEPFEPAPYGDEQGSPVDGQFPKEVDRSTGTPEQQEYIYRPDPLTGSNEFQRYGPDLDEKIDALKY
jgi:hypothetical protein